MTWEELEAYRKIHLEFQRRALEKHAEVASRGNELLIRGDLPSPVEDGQVTGGRTVPGSSDYFGAAATNPGTRRRTSRVAGQSSDNGPDMTWKDLEACRKIHLQFQKRALEKHAEVASRGNELLIRGDLPSPVEDGQVTGGRTVPGSSDYFGAAVTNPGMRRRTSRVAGQSSDNGI